MYIVVISDNENDTKVFLERFSRSVIFKLFITDLGMCGPIDSILGTDPDVIINRMVKRELAPFTKATGKVKICGASVTVNLDTGYVVDIKRIQFQE